VPADRVASIHFEGDEPGQYADDLVVHWIHLPPAR
jgi:hypothetical protein